MRARGRVVYCAASRPVQTPARSTGIVADGYRTLAEGTRVSYDEEQGDKGTKAGNVQKV